MGNLLEKVILGCVPGRPMNLVFYGQDRSRAYKYLVSCSSLSRAAEYLTLAHAMPFTERAKSC